MENDMQLINFAALCVCVCVCVWRDGSVVYIVSKVTLSLWLVHWFFTRRNATKLDSAANLTTTKVCIRKDTTLSLWLL